MREICVMAQYENKKVMLKPDEQMHQTLLIALKLA